MTLTGSTSLLRAVVLDSGPLGLASNPRRQTADPHALDGDVILAAQALALGLPSGEVVVATSNAAHLAQFIVAKAWQDIG